MARKSTPVADQETDVSISARDATLTQETTLVTAPPPGVTTVGGEPVRASQVEIEAEASALVQYIASVSPSLGLQFTQQAGLLASTGIHQLPLYIDELERDFGTDMYLRLLNDAVVKAADATLRYSVLDKEMQLSLGIDEKTEKDAKRRKLAEEVLEFCQKAVEHIEGDVFSINYEMLEGIALGYKLAELVWELADLGLSKKKGKQLVIKAVKPKPQEAVSILASVYNDVLGYIPRDPLTGVYGEVWPAEDGTIPGMVPEEKVWRFTWSERNSDPRGTSHLRAAYVPWRLKIGLYPAYEAYMARYAQPSVAHELGGAEVPAVVDPDTGSMTSSPLAVATKLLTALRNFQAGGAMVAPVGQVKLVESMTKGEAFLHAFTFVNREITKSILMAELATTESEHGTRAQAEVHQDTMSLPTTHGKQLLSAAWRVLLGRMVRYNYGDEAMSVIPKVTFGETQQQDFGAVAAAAGTLIDKQAIIPAQYNEILEMLHFPEIPQDIIDMMMEAFKAKLQASVAQSQQAMMAPPPGSPGVSGPAPGGQGGGLPSAPPAPGGSQVQQPPGAFGGRNMGGGGRPAPSGPPGPGQRSPTGSQAGSQGGGQPPRPGKPSFRPFRGQG